MAGQGEPSVLRWWPYYVAAGKKWGIPPAVLAAQVHMESRGREGQTSRAGAQGLTQFLPGTAKSYGVDVRPGHAASQIDGAAHYLHDLGYSTDPRKAIASYAAGPGNYTAGLSYADQLLGLAHTTYSNVAGGATIGTVAGVGVGPLNDAGNAAGNAVSNIPPFKQIKDAASAISTVWETLTNPKTWLRVLYFVGGLALGVLAIKQLATAAGSV